MIIFLTDGQPNDAASAIIQTIKTKNAELNNAVVIMTYGMLMDLQILRDIAKQDGSNYGVSKAPDVTVSTITAMRESHISTQCITAPLYIMRALKFKAQPTKSFFATVNQIFGGSSQAPTTAESVVMKSLSTGQTMKQCSAGVGSLEEPPNIWLTIPENDFVG